MYQEADTLNRNRKNISKTKEGKSIVVKNNSHVTLLIFSKLNRRIQSSDTASRYRETLHRSLPPSSPVIEVYQLQLFF